MLKHAKGITMVMALVLLVCMVGTAYAFNARHNPPWEYVCDNDPGQPQCGGKDVKGNLTLGTINTAWAQDARWRTQKANADGFYQWTIKTGDQPYQTGSWYEFRVHIPTSGTAFTAPWATYYDFDRSGSAHRIGTVNQAMNQGTWYLIESAYWMADNSSYLIESNNGYLGNPPSGVTGFDALDLWDN